MAGLENDWQAKLKRVFIIPLMLADIAFVVIGAVAGWWGVVLAATGQFLLFAMISMKRSRRLNAAPALAVSLAGVVWAAADGVGAFVVALLALVLLVAYAVWYSRNGRTKSAALALGSR